MKIILTSNIKKLGKIGDLVKVKDGFARNFLFPQKKALRNTKDNAEKFEKIKIELAEKEKIKKENAQKILEKINQIKFTFLREADENGQLYGSVSLKDVQKYLIDENIEIDVDDISFEKPIKSTGEHAITINPYDGLSKKITLIVNNTK